jgi:creatinine amidohydrolase/Fe(II)-dependent formamide hydrolase-like protein
VADRAIRSFDALAQNGVVGNAPEPDAKHGAEMVGTAAVRSVDVVSEIYPYPLSNLQHGTLE